MSYPENSFLCYCDVSLIPLLNDFSRMCEVSIVGGEFFCILFSPHYELFETQTQFIVVTKELRVCWDFIQKDLGHLQWALKHRGGERRDNNKDRELDSQRKQKRELRRRDSSMVTVTTEPAYIHHLSPIYPV